MFVQEIKTKNENQLQIYSIFVLAEKVYLFNCQKIDLSLNQKSVILLLTYHHQVH